MFTSLLHHYLATSLWSYLTTQHSWWVKIGFVTPVMLMHLVTKKISDDDDDDDHDDDQDL